MERSLTNFRCSHEEAVFLAKLAGGHELIGIPDPFFGWLTEEIQAAWPRALDQLLARGLVVDDGGLALSPDIAVLVDTWCDAEATLIVTVTTDEGSTDLRYFHMKGSLAVEQSLPDAHTCGLAGLPASALLERVVDVCRLPMGAPPACAESGILPEAGLLAALDRARGGDCAATRDALVGAGLAPAVADALARSFVDSRSNGAVVALRRGEVAWDVHGFGLLDGGPGLWRLNTVARGDEQWIEATPRDAAQAREDLRRLFHRALLPAGSSPERPG